MSEGSFVKVVIGILIGLAIAYFFLWGKPYKNLEAQYDDLQSNFTKLNETYTTLQTNYAALEANYTLVAQEFGNTLRAYEACVGRETFFKWIERSANTLSVLKMLGFL